MAWQALQNIFCAWSLRLKIFIYSNRTVNDFHLTAQKPKIIVPCQLNEFSYAIAYLLNYNTYIILKENLCLHSLHVI